MHNHNMAKEWIKASLIDLKVIEEIIDNDSLTSMTAFHSQQSIEKSLKAVLEYYNQEIPKIHHVKKLFKLVEKQIQISIEIDLVMKMDSLYIDSRYPGEMGLLPYGNPTLEDAKEFYTFALHISDKVCDTLNIEKDDLT